MPPDNEPKKVSVPWTGWDVLLFLFLWFMAQIVCGIVGVIAERVHSFHSSHRPLEQVAVEKGKDHGHPVFQMIEQSKNSPIVFLTAFLAIVVAAPLIEEFLFRLLLQGWLEAKLAQYRVPCASGVAIVAVSFFFALLHGGNSGAMNAQMLFYLFAAVAFASFLIFTAGIIYLTDRAAIKNEKITDYLFGTDRFFHPHFFLYAKYCFLALLFVFGMTAALDAIYPQTNTDPIPIFFFSLVLGTLYSRSRNLSYCILLHACLNFTSLAIVWFSA